MLSRKSKYGLKALLVLAQQDGRGPVLVADIATQEAIPKKFLEAILLDLNRRGFVQSKKGKGGGYFLRRAPAGSDTSGSPCRRGEWNRSRTVTTRSRTADPRARDRCAARTAAAYRLASAPRVGLH